MKMIPFTKMSAAGNDFIMIDNRTAAVDPARGSELARSICRRKLSVGADGLILIEDSQRVDFKWRFFNADGSEAEMCGNGGRCAARFAHRCGIAPASLSFETLAGIIKAEVMQERVKLELTPASRPELGITLMLEDKPYTMSSITVGVPHAVLFVDNLDGCPVVTLGRQIRFHDRFKPAGTNADFVAINDSSTLAVRTYERGVEDETLACGTGSVASALIAGITRGMSSPLSVITRGGEILTVHFSLKQGMPVEMFLEGGADFIYEGQLYSTII
jgi:diaminopimelate epimerase